MPSHELDYNPCLTCKLCVAACPVGAIGADGGFNFSACYTHDYREFMGGFANWVETVAESRDGRDYGKRVPETETISTWQSLAFGPNYKAAYCMAVCPAGDEVIAPYRLSKKDFMEEIVPSAAGEKGKSLCHPGLGCRAARAQTLSAQIDPARPRLASPAQYPHFSARSVDLLFQRQAAGELDATYHFTFTGAEKAEASIVIRGGTIAIAKELDGHPGSSRHCRLDDLARFSRQGKKSALGAFDAADQAARQPEVAARLRPLFPELSKQIMNIHKRQNYKNRYGEWAADRPAHHPASVGPVPWTLRGWV